MASTVARRAGRGWALAGVAGAIEVFGWLHYLGRTWGSTGAERDAPMPGDDIVRKPFGVTDHAVSIAAPPALVWKWVVQTGYHRAGWYTPRWVDTALWHIDNPSTETILEQCQEIRVGDVIPDGDPGTAFYWVLQAEPASALVLYSTTHLPSALRGRWWVDWTWSFRLEPINDGAGTRLRLRVRGTGSPAVWLAWHLTIVPSDSVMARSMLHGIKRRAERAAAQPLTAAGVAA